MKRLAGCLSGLVFTCVALHAQTIAQWTFETSVPAGTPGAGVWLTNITAELGQGVASGLHSGAATYSTPVGNGSAHSFSANTWNPGDFAQFAVSTVSYDNIGVSFDHVSSSTGPGKFLLQYSTDGSTFTQFGSDYTVLVNTAPNAWSSNPLNQIFTTSYSYDLSSVLGLNNASTVFFRLVDENTVSAGGATVAAGGTSRIDNFSVFVVPEPQSLSLLLGGMGLLIWNRMRRR